MENNNVQRREISEGESEMENNNVQRTEISGGESEMENNNVQRTEISEGESEMENNNVQRTEISEGEAEMENNNVQRTEISEAGESEMENDNVQRTEISEGDEMITKKKKLGGFTTMPFILSSEVCETFAGAGFHSNMMNYLTTQFNLPNVKASSILTNLGGTVTFTPLIAALIADSFAGRFWTITFGVLIHVVGMVGITATAILPNLRPPHCQTQENCIEASSPQVWFFCISLLLMCIGSGGIKACVVFSADQIDMTKSKVESPGCNFFNVYYFCMGIASLLAQTVVVYIQDHAGRGWGFGIPTIAMGLSILAFVVGSPLYIKVKPSGSPLVRLTQVVVAAFNKRNTAVPADASLLYDNSELDAAFATKGRLLHSNQYKWLDRAAVITNDELEGSTVPNLWRLATVHRVEEVKSIIRMIPIWTSGILLAASSSQISNFVIKQAGTMDRHMSPSFEIPAASLQVFSGLTFLIVLGLYDRFFAPLARRVTKIPTGITCLQRIGTGFFFKIIATLVSGLVEIKRKSAAKKYGLLDNPTRVIPISVFWLVPQYCLSAMADVFTNVGQVEFLYDQSPESLKSTVLALNGLMGTVGNYVGVFMATMVHQYTEKGGNWLPDWNLNRGKFDHYYWLSSGIQVVNLVYFVTVAWFYTYKSFEELADKSDDGDSESETRERALGA